MIISWFRKVLAVICIAQAVNNAERALGYTPQYLFTSTALWVWWIAVAAWLWLAVCMFFKESIR